MKVFLSIKYHPDLANKPRIDAVLDLLTRHSMQPVCIPVMNASSASLEPEELMRTTLIELRSCKLVVVELSEKGVGIGIEAGYAHARGIPVITIVQGHQEVSESLVGISDEVFYYRDWNDLDWFLGLIERKYVPKDDLSANNGSRQKVNTKIP